MTSGAPLVEVRGLVRRFGDVVAVGGVSFTVEAGETFGLIGPDGAGKSTVLRMILGLLAPDEGTLTVCGHDPQRQRRALSRVVGYLAQRFSLYGDLTVDENIAFFARIHGVKGWRPRRDELLELLRMTPFRDRLADRLSGGMKQKLALACTVIHTPRLLVLDEPTTGVDPVSRRDFWRILSRLQRDGLTVLLTTPYLDEAERCRRVGLMDHGRLLVTEFPDALRDAHPGCMVEVLAAPKDRARRMLESTEDVADVQVFGERLHASLPTVPRTAGAARAADLARLLRERGIEVHEARAVAATLEDVFIARLRGAAVDGSPPEVNA